MELNKHLMTDCQVDFIDRLQNAEIYLNGLSDTESQDFFSHTENCQSCQTVTRRVALESQYYQSFFHYPEYPIEWNQLIEKRFVQDYELFQVFRKDELARDYQRKITFIKKFTLQIIKFCCSKELVPYYLLGVFIHYLIKSHLE